MIRIYQINEDISVLIRDMEKDIFHINQKIII